jgi:hypothetical protein
MEVAAVSESPGWVNVVREDANGHAIDKRGFLVEDPRCWLCQKGVQVAIGHPNFNTTSEGAP